MNETNVDDAPESIVGDDDAGAAPTESPVEAPTRTEPAAQPETPSFGFDTLNLRPELLSSLVRLGYEEPTPIQRETIPLLLQGGDLVGQAATGTGKTAAFALPILNRMPAKDGKPVTYALVLVPTRELAVQVSEAMYKYGRDLGAKVLPIYGGQPIGRQLHALHDGVHVVVATPGRALDHIARGTLQLDSVQIVVLDEADEMLDMGFADEIEGILDATPTARQTVLFSATLPPRINSIAKKYLRDPQRIQVGQGGQNSLANTPRIRQSAYIVQRAHKAAALGRILDVETPTAAIVFCRTRDEVDQLTETMNGRGYRAEALHGGMSQEQRDRVMGRVRAGTAELLMATDVAARGLDIDTLTHVVNYDVPSAPEAYVHRIGRVGRAGREGVAITLAEPREQRQLANIERLTKRKISIEKVPSVADLRAKQIEFTLNQVRDAGFRPRDARCSPRWPPTLRPPSRTVGSSTGCTTRPAPGSTRRSTTRSPGSRTGCCSAGDCATSSTPPIGGNGPGPIVGLMDLDDFKLINDTLGHHWGDHSLVEVARRLSRAAGPSVTIARLGGDEFALLVPSKHDVVIDEFARRLHDAVVEPLVLGGQRVSIGISIGLAAYDAHGIDGAVLMRRADAGDVPRQTERQGRRRGRLRPRPRRRRARRALTRRWRLGPGTCRRAGFHTIRSTFGGRVRPAEAHSSHRSGAIAVASPSVGVLGGRATAADGRTRRDRRRRGRRWPLPRVGGCSPASQIVARVWSFDEDERIDAEFIARRVAAAAARREPLAPRTDACRLVFSESDGLPA